MGILSLGVLQNDYRAGDLQLQSHDDPLDADPRGQGRYRVRSCFHSIEVSYADKEHDRSDSNGKSGR